MKMKFKWLSIVVITFILLCNYQYSLAGASNNYTIAFNTVGTFASKFLNDSTTPPQRIVNPDGIILWSSVHHSPVLRFHVSVPESGTLSVKMTSSTFYRTHSTVVNNLSIKSPEIYRIGIERGYSIATIDIPLSSTSLVYQHQPIIDAGEVEVAFEGRLDKVSKSDLQVYKPSDVLNPNYRMSRGKRVNLLNTQNTTLDNTKNYIKLTTTKDGVAFIRGSDLLSLKPEWKGQMIRWFHLTHFGKEEPLFITDSNSLLHDTTILYFLGHRAKGDSTWYNNYTEESPYFIFVDSSLQSSRYLQPSFNQNAPLVNKLYQANHYEKETDYSYGYSTGFDEYTVLITETVPGEKWFWQSTDQYNSFTENVLIAPTEDSNDSISIKLRYNTKNNDFTFNRDQHPQFYINTTLIAEEVFDGPSERDFSKKFSSDDLTNGVTEVLFKSVVESGKSYASNQYVDYITVDGFQKPFAGNGMYQGTYNHPIDYNVSIPGFTSRNIYLIDTLHKTFTFLNGIPGITIHLGATKNTTTAWQSIVLNDSILLSTKENQLSIIALQYPDYSISSAKKWEGNANNVKAVEFILSQPTNTQILLTSTDNNFSQDLFSYFEEYNSKFTSSTNNENEYCALFIKDDKSSLIENFRKVNSGIFTFIQNIGGVSYQATTTLLAGKGNISITDENNLEHAKIYNVDKALLHDTLNRADYIIITNSIFKQQALELAQYRAKQGWKTTTVDVNDIYNEFTNGSKSPVAIKEFLKYAYEHWSKPAPRYILLFGDASWDPRRIGLLGRMNDYVPSYGNPVSDYWYSLIDGDDLIPDVSIGRIPCTTEKEAQNVVQKIIEYDTVKPDKWWKRFLFISGGYGLEEERMMYDVLRYRVSPYISDETNPYRICGDTISAALFLTHSLPGFSLSNHIIKNVNEGCSWINYSGHGAPSVMQVGGWDVTSLNNKGKYPVLATFSCKNGGFAERDVVSTNEQYLLEKDKGVAAAIGTTGYGFTTIDEEINALYFFTMVDRRSELRRLGDIINTAKKYFIEGREDDQRYRNVMYQVSLLGDPLTRLPFDTVVHPYVIRNENVFVSTLGENVVTNDMDSADVIVTIHNSGMYDSITIPVRLVREYAGKLDTVYQNVQGLCGESKIRFRYSVKDMPGEHKFYLLLDPFGTVPILTEIVNDTISGYVYSPSLLAVDPFPGWNVSYDKPQFRFINPLSSSGEYRYQLELRSMTDSILIKSIDFDSNTINGFNDREIFLEWKPDVQLRLNHNYEVRIRSKELKTSSIGAWLVIPFTSTLAVENNLATLKQGNTLVWNQAELQSFRSLRHNDSNSLVLNYFIPYTILSAGGVGYWDTIQNKFVLEIERSFKINIQGKQYGDRNDLVGFNVRTLPRHDTVVRLSKWFYTFENGANRGDGDADELVAFLKDSIQNNEYVFFAACGNGYGDYLLDKKMDSVRILLKQLGAKLVDSIDNRNIVRSYVLVGMKNSQYESVKEKIRPEVNRFAGDTVTITDSVRVSPLQGSIKSQIFGPAKNWKSLHVSGNLKPTNSKVIVKIFGGSSLQSVNSLILSDTVENIDLQPINANVYPYIKYQLDVTRTNFTTDPIVNSINLELEPLTEIAIVPSKVTITPDSVLRGDTSITTTTVKVISPRVPIDSIGQEFNYFPLEGTALQVINDKVAYFNESENSEVADTIPSLGLSTLSSVKCEVNPFKTQRELYYFNNQYSKQLKVANDTTKPLFRLFADDIEVRDGNEVSANPILTVFMDDNIRLPFTEPSLFKSKRYDGKIPDLESTYKFFTTLEVSKLANALPNSKLAFTFKPILDFGRHELKVRGSDIFGNEQTATWTFSVAKEIQIKTSNITPNPVSNSAIFNFVYRGTQQDFVVQIDIFDNMGRVVRSLGKKSRLGSNQIEWDGLDLNGESLSQGVYHYRIYFNEFGAESPQNGTFIIVR